jgi:ABC-type Fe3+-hydroxamate transport system substrate-binding protein
VNRRKSLIGVACLWGVGILAAGTRTHAADPDTRQLTDAAGRLVTIPARVTRVADPWHANNSTVLMLGGADKIVATTAQAQNQPWFRRLYPRIKQVPAAFNTAGEVNIEALIGARPDVILMAYDGTLPRWAEAVSAYHVPIVLMPNRSLAELKITVRMTGEVLGESESRVAAEYLRYFDDNIRRVTSVTDKLEARERPKVLHTASAGAGHFRQPAGAADAENSPGTRGPACGRNPAARLHELFESFTQGAAPRLLQRAQLHADS